MLGFVLIYWIGKYFYRLADQFNQKKWLFAILGVGFYYASMFVGGAILGFLDALFNWGVNWDNAFIGLLAIPFGLSAVYLFYTLLKKKWEKSFVEEKDEIDQIGTLIE
ncbi:hypothetical protein [Mangrovimonas aestuarii]|uniref:hypothetical protein n=1 Tax=Mangrovimonas aestuarii TaxID=3018443 RepID=UPI00237A03BE|nr:hypothetical protein [Mangrovimonas aestuarii]